MTKCPKCGSRRINGPHYVTQRGLFDQRDGLRYSCGKCGYNETTNTLEQDEKEPAWWPLPKSP